MGFFTSLFGSRKIMHQRATQGVDMVKIGLSMYLLPDIKANFDTDYASPLTAAVVNTVFSEPPSNEAGQLFLEDEENQRNIDLVIERMIKPQEKLCRIITDAVRVKCMQSYGLNPNLPKTEFHRLCREPIEKLKQLGLLISGGEMPTLNIFLDDAGKFVAACKEDLDLHESQ